MNEDEPNHAKTNKQTAEAYSFKHTLTLTRLSFLFHYEGFSRIVKEVFKLIADYVQRLEIIKWRCPSIRSAGLSSDG